MSARNANRRSATLGALSALLLWSASTFADSSSPRLAAFYDRFMALCGDRVYEWSDDEAPRKVMTSVRQVGVGRDNRYALTESGTLVVWNDNETRAERILDRVESFHAGRSGLLIIRDDASLWHLETQSLFGIGEGVGKEPTRIAGNVLTASVGDGANYYVTVEGALFVKGRANRGQYGDGKLTSTDGYVQTAANVVQIASHTGHALVLKSDGSVWGTGGNIYGPVGHHGYGDKAAEWGAIFDGAKAIATGSSHSLAIRRDDSLWIWGRNEGLEPKQVLSGVSAVAAGTHTTIALGNGTLWQWNTGAEPRRVMACAD